MPIVELLELINSELLKSFRTIYGFHNALVEHMQPEAFFQYTILTATIKVFQILR